MGSKVKIDRQGRQSSIWEGTLATCVCHSLFSSSYELGAPGWSDIALICISIQTGPYYSPISGHHCASRLLSSQFSHLYKYIQSWSKNEKVSNNLYIPQPTKRYRYYPSLKIIFLLWSLFPFWLAEQLYYLMINDRALSGFPCKAISIGTFHFSKQYFQTPTCFLLLARLGAEVFDKWKFVHVIKLVGGGVQSPVVVTTPPNSATSQVL